MPVSFSLNGGGVVITDTVSGIVWSGNNSLSFDKYDNKINVIAEGLGGSGNARLIGSYALSDITTIGGSPVAGTLDAAILQLTQLLPSATTVTITGEVEIKNDAGNPVPVLPSMASGGNISAQTAATGTNWTAYGSQACKQLTLSNQSGTTIEVRQGGGGVGLQIPTGAFYTFFGITNANQLEVRRVDTSNTQVTITARWEA